jgi:hypothetical protein
MNSQSDGSREEDALRPSGEGGRVVPSGDAAASAPTHDAEENMQDERDEYGGLLASLGRTEEQDQRIAVHEAGHAVCARLLGHALGGATVDPGPGYEGRVWSERHVEAFVEGRGDASDVREALASLMPNDGEDHSAVSDIFGSSYTQVIELMAGRAAERMLLDGEPASPVDDLRQARELALLFCKSEEAVEAFITHCDVAARDLLLPYGALVIALSGVLRIKRTMNGTEIDELIADVQARKARAIELARRADCKRRELSARTFLAEIKSRL